MTETSRPAHANPNPTKTFGRASGARETVGIEVGYGVLYLVLLRQTGDGRILLKKCHSVEFDPSLDTTGPSFTALLKSELKQFCSSSKEAEVWAMPHLDRANIHNIRIPQVSPSRLAGAVFWGLQRKESFIEKDTVADFQVEEHTSTKATLDVSCALVDRPAVEDLRQTFSQAGFPLSGVSIPQFALRNLVNLLGYGEQKAPVLICQLGVKATSVSVLFQHRIVFTRNIPLGLQNLAEILIKELDPPPTHGEACQLILKPGQTEELRPAVAYQHESVPGLLRPVLERLVRQIERTIEHYQTNFDTEPLEVIFLGGEFVSKTHLFNFISKRLSSRVLAIDPFDLPGLQAQGPVPSDIVKRIAFGPAIGLALEGNRGGINLAHSYKDRQSDDRLSKIATAVTLAMILVTSFATLFYHSKWTELQDLEANQKGLESKLDSLGPAITEATITRKNLEARELSERRRAAAKRYEGLALLSEISRFTPENIALLHISVAMESPVTILDGGQTSSRDEGQAALKQGTMLIKGVVTGERTDLETALTIYVARLGNSSLIENVDVTTTEFIRSPDSMRMTFTLSVQTAREGLKAITRK